MACFLFIVNIATAELGITYEESTNTYDEPSGGGWGGSCTCPDGTVYEVGDKEDSFRAQPELHRRYPGHVCNRERGAWSGMQVTCGSGFATPTYLGAIAPLSSDLSAIIFAVFYIIRGCHTKKYLKNIIKDPRVFAGSIHETCNSLPA